jgi:hypothetical protein
MFINYFYNSGHFVGACSNNEEGIICPLLRKTFRGSNIPTLFTTVKGDWEDLETLQGIKKDPFVRVDVDEFREVFGDFLPRYVPKVVMTTICDLYRTSERFGIPLKYKNHILSIIERVENGTIQDIFTLIQEIDRAGDIILEDLEGRDSI